jgi:hypothetical protein
MQSTARRALAPRLACAALIGALVPALAWPARPAHPATPHPPQAATVAPPHEPLSYSDEFDRAELVEEMLKECRGVSYNAYELVQSTGEALWLPAPIQLMTVRVKHPYCATLLRTYAPKIAV